ncbi:hypothetical protein I4U23_024580 [Adineta vaga]|nr:hypothetical protein I4U23_024580 [Adineta vaga]
MASKTKKTKEPSASAAALPIVTDPEMAERFERELTWCVGQLECMLKSPSMKDKEPPRSALQVLTNPKTAFVRKRQMMQQLFGDYRQKMHDEDVARQKRHNQIRASTNSEIPLASRFVRRTNQTNDSTTKDNTFSFNFDIPLTDMDKN